MAGDFDDRRSRRDHDRELSDDPEERPWRPTVAPGKLSRSAAVYARVQRSAASGGPVQPEQERLDAAARSQGQGLPSELRADLEQSLGADLSGVRVHTGSESGAAAESIHAKAYTTGSDIHFAAGTWDPDSDDGRRLIAHEVAHTVQQAGGSSSVQTKLEVSQPSDAAEVEADQFAAAFVSRAEAPRIQQTASTVVARNASQPRPAPAQADEAESDDGSPLDFERNVRLASQLVAKLAGTFAPKHIAARDGLRAGPARSNGEKAAASILRIRAHLDAAKAGLHGGPDAAAARGSWEQNPADPMLRRVARIEAQVEAFASEIAPMMGLQAFRGELIPDNQGVGAGDLAHALDDVVKRAHLPMTRARKILEQAPDPSSGHDRSIAIMVHTTGLDVAQNRFCRRIVESESGATGERPQEAPASKRSAPASPPQRSAELARAVHVGMMKASKDYAAEYAELNAEIEAVLGRPLDARETTQLQQLAVRRADELLRLEKQERDLAAIEADLAELRQKQHTFRLYDAGILQPPKKSLAEEVWHEATGGDSGRRGITGAVRTVKDAVVNTVEESGRLREQAIERGDYAGAAFTPLSAIAIESVESVADGLALAEKAIHERLEAKTFKEKRVAELRVLLGFGEAVLGAWGMVEPVSPRRVGGRRPGAGGGAPALATAGGGAGVVVPGAAAAGGALGRPAIVMAVAGLDDMAPGSKGGAQTDVDTDRGATPQSEADHRPDRGTEPDGDGASGSERARDSVFGKESVEWQATRPKGTQQNYQIRQRTDIDWKYVRTEGDKRAIGMTNREAGAKFGLPPQLNEEGYFATLHHIGQDSRGPIVEASTKYHGVGSEYQDALHSQYGRSQPHPTHQPDRKKFDVDTREYWKTRARQAGGK